MAPAELVFHAVTDLSIDLTWMRSGYQACIHHVAIEDIHRVQQSPEEQRVHHGSPYDVWRIATSGPRGEISFGALGFTQTLTED